MSQTNESATVPKTFHFSKLNKAIAANSQSAHAWHRHPCWALPADDGDAFDLASDKVTGTTLMLESSPSASQMAWDVPTMLFLQVATLVEVALVHDRYCGSARRTPTSLRAIPTPLERVHRHHRGCTTLGRHLWVVVVPGPGHGAPRRLQKQDRDGGHERKLGARHCCCASLRCFWLAY